MAENTLRVIPLGGCGEIGMNMTVVHVDDTYYFMDGGALFPDAGLPGVELILPEITWLLESGIKPEAWLITHGHEDHIGALPYLYPHFPVPIYGSEFTLELIKGKFEEAGIQNVTYKLWVPNETVAFRNIKLTPFTVNHSIAHALGFFIETRHGNILHTGDFRIDEDPPERTMTHENIAKAVGKKKVHLMLSDSTGSFSQGTDLSENDLAPTFEKIIDQGHGGAVVFATFASNIWRYQSVLDAAVAKKRKVFFLGRSMLRNLEIAEKLRLIQFPRSCVIEDDELMRTPKGQVIIVCTGSQGEPFSGASRLAYNMFEKMRLDANDTVVFSARAIPGNEKSIGAIVNQFSRLGCRVVTAKEAPCHVSGHGYQEDLKTVIRTAKPLHFMPVHGEFRHLKKHIELAVEAGVAFDNCFLAENGDVVVAGPEARGVIDRVTSGRDYVIAGGVVNAMSEVYRTRVSMAKNGMVCVSFVLKSGLNELACRPVLANKGVPLDENDLQGKLKEIFRKALATVGGEAPERENGRRGQGGGPGEGQGGGQGKEGSGANDANAIAAGNGTGGNGTGGNARNGERGGRNGGRVGNSPKAGATKRSLDLDALGEELRIQVRRAIEAKTDYKCIVSVLISRVGD